MEWLRKLQAAFRSGKITKEQYEARAKLILEDEDITQTEYDEALKFDPSKGSDAIYTQEDVDKMAAGVARRYLKQTLDAAGIKLEGVANKDLIGKVVELTKTGLGKGDGKADDKEIADLRVQAAKVPALEAQVKGAAIENAVFKGAARYGPVNLAQVARAIASPEYAALLEYDGGNLVVKSVGIAFRKLTESEPNLFTNPNGDGPDEENSQGDKGDQGQNTFRSKSPGGGGGGAKPNTKDVANLALARELMGLKGPEATK